MRLLVRIGLLFEFIAFYLWQILLSNLRVAYEILTPRNHMKPGFLVIPLRAQTDMEILLVANLLTMTPGTVSLDVSSDRRFLYLHAMYVEDREKVRRLVQEQYERRVLALLRGPEARI